VFKNTAREHGRNFWHPCSRPWKRPVNAGVIRCVLVTSVSNTAREHGCHFLTAVFTGRVHVNTDSVHSWTRGAARDMPPPKSTALGDSWLAWNIISLYYACARIAPVIKLNGMRKWKNYKKMWKPQSSWPGCSALDKMFTKTVVFQVGMRDRKNDGNIFGDQSGFIWLAFYAVGRKRNSICRQATSSAEDCSNCLTVTDKTAAM